MRGENGVGVLMLEGVCGESQILMGQEIRGQEGRPNCPSLGSKWDQLRFSEKVSHLQSWLEVEELTHSFSFTAGPHLEEIALSRFPSKLTAAT